MGSEEEVGVSVVLVVVGVLTSEKCTGLVVNAINNTPLGMRIDEWKTASLGGIFIDLEGVGGVVRQSRFEWGGECVNGLEGPPQSGDGGPEGGTCARSKWGWNCIG